MKVPQTNDSERQRAKEIILEIIRASGGKFEGKIRLYKTFMFAHLYHFEDHNRILSNWPIVHMPQGHGIDDADSLIAELANERKLSVSYKPNGPYQEAQYETTSSNNSWFLTQEAIESIKRSAEFVRGKSATQLSDYVHENSRSWNVGDSGKELNIYIDALSDEEYSQEQGHIGRISESIEAIFRD